MNSSTQSGLPENLQCARHWWAVMNLDVISLQSSDRGENGAPWNLTKSGRTWDSFLEEVTSQMKPLGQGGVWQTKEGQG